MCVTLLVDADDTISNFCETWVNHLNEAHWLNVKMKDIKEWDIRKVYPTLTDNQIYEPLNIDKLWKKVQPAKMSYYYLKELSKRGIDIYLCSSSYYKTIAPKYECFIRDKFDFIPYSKIIFTSNKKMINADILVDDGLHNLIDGKYLKLLVDKPHNRKCDEKDLIRVYSWKEIYDIVLNYKMIKLSMETIKNSTN